MEVGQKMFRQIREVISPPLAKAIVYSVQDYFDARNISGLGPVQVSERRKVNLKDELIKMSVCNQINC